ncbi:MAG: tetraacyldisaccharide 4'-kinase [Rhodocyclales bacterium]|nr:tetraacyldisaccharide 4'-kinase [Rhodocyclales bacterium]
MEETWQSRGALSWLLLPASFVFAGLAALRRGLYRAGLLVSVRLPVPVVVVGNITAGGAGKTPLVLWLVDELRRRGRHPGVISRGYGGDAAGVQEVSHDDTPARVGDEPLLIKRRAGCPLFVGRDRAAAGLALLAAHPECDIVICDDGLQHYRLARDVEIAVVDRRGFWNGWPMPAGPLREPVSRLRSVDAVVANGWEGAAAFRMTLQGDRFVPLAGSAGLGEMKRLHAVAGIGEPQRFFDHLAALGLHFEPHPFPDHHAYVAGDLAFDGDAILTTEKDAVKFGGLAALPVWVLPVTATVTPDLAQFVLERIDGRPPA